MSDINDTFMKDLLGPLEDELEFFFTSYFGTSYPSLYRKELYWKPPTDVFETDHNFVVILELAQMKPEEVSITFQDGILYIRGIRKSIPASEQRRYHKMEINYGPFERRVAITEDVDIEKLSATYSDGFLEIRLPKISKQSEEKIDIEVE